MKLFQITNSSSRAFHLDDSLTFFLFPFLDFRGAASKHRFFRSELNFSSWTNTEHCRGLRDMFGLVSIRVSRISSLHQCIINLHPGLSDLQTQRTF